MVPLPIATVQVKFKEKKRKQSLLVFKDIFTEQPSHALLKTIKNSNHCDRSQNQPKIYTGYACSVRMKFVELNHCSSHFLLHLCTLGVVHDRDSVASPWGYCEGLVFDVVLRNCVVDTGKGLVVQTDLVFHCCSHFGDIVFDSSFQCKFFGSLSQAQASIGVQ